VISSFRREGYQNCALLGDDAASNGNSFPTFRDNLSVPLLRVKNYWMNVRVFIFVVLIGYPLNTLILRIKRDDVTLETKRLISFLPLSFCAVVVLLYNLLWSLFALIRCLVVYVVLLHAAQCE